MQILIYGGGAVGLGLASFLIKGKAQVDILARKNTAEALCSKGLIRTGIFGDFSAKPDEFGCYEKLGQIKQKTYDYILVCTKSFDSSQAAENLSKHKNLMKPKAIIVLFQNGWGNAEKFLPFFENEKIYSARVITGFHRAKDNVVDITVHADAIHIGSLFCSDVSEVQSLCKLISEGGLPCQTTEAIEKDLWAKMLYNCALNPLGAILDVPYGVLAQYQTTRTIMDEIIREIFKILQASGNKTHWQKPDDFLKVFYERLVPDTAKHKSSTLQDITAKKKTEIDALNGSVIELAEKHKIAVPYNRTIYNLVKFLESQNPNNIS